MLWRRKVEPFLRPLIHAWFRASRGLTLGVRGLVLDAEGRVLLIEHTYVPGWHLPGGGVERSEPAEEALRRELVEEVGVSLTGPPRLVSIHSNDPRHRGDHVLLFVCEAWEPCTATSKGEIQAVRWFAPTALPEGTTPSVRARIREVLQGEPPNPLW